MLRRPSTMLLQQLMHRYDTGCVSGFISIEGYGERIVSAFAYDRYIASLHSSFVIQNKSSKESAQKRQEFYLSIKLENEDSK